ncbi:hypothetical protein PSN13_01346 [Micromonospora saelicesensis]|uniref:Uncharacterized protein n=1 Tax=Micromonospora saelicesensis TaxID=285676 RepID=A0A328NQL8_9ACTN|nr:hypothetical protein PSN13_01346 [Micromonospora saelicesensis]
MGVLGRWETAIASIPQDATVDDLLLMGRPRADGSASRLVASLLAQRVRRQAAHLGVAHLIITTAEYGDAPHESLTSFRPATARP